jgi:hypothetical protein
MPAPVTLSFAGRVFATPSAVTIILDGTEVFSGQVGSGQPLDTQINLFDTSIPAPLANTVTTHSVSMSVTSGVITIGDVCAQYSDGTYMLLLSGENSSGPDLRQNILVNGSLPDWPATPVDPMPGGTSSDPNWQGWFFEVSAGETITFTVPIGVPLSG